MAPFPRSRHFELQELSDGVYAAIHAEGGLAQSNAGIVDLGDRTLVFDAFLSPQATDDLLAAATAVTGQPADLVLNSHYHNDHTWGSQAVPLGTPIISTLQTRDLILSKGAQEDEWNRKHAGERLARAKLQLEQAPDGTAKTIARYYAAYAQAVVDTLPALQIRLPNILFKDWLEFKGSRRSARFINMGAGHTGSDAILELPDDRILFLADLLFIGVHPYLPDGDPVRLRQATVRLKGLPADILVPGHGPVGGPGDLDVMLQYIDALQGLVTQARADGTTLEQLSASSIPAEYATWLFSSFYPENLEFLYRRYSAG